MANWIEIEGTSQTIGPSLLLSCEWDIQVNEENSDLCPGTVAVGELSFDFIAEGITLNQGDVIKYYNDLSGSKTLIATCICEKPEYTGVMRGGETSKTYSVIAYDYASKTEKNLSSWLMDNQGIFPLSLQDFADAVAAQCGVTIATGPSLNAGHEIPAFYADNLTGRQLLSWVAQATCTFVRANPEGQLVFGWYTNAEEDVGPGGAQARAIVRLSDGSYLRTSRDEVYTIGVEPQFYYEGSLSYDDFQCQQIDKVQIKLTDDDVGTIYPPEEKGENAYVISGNLLLTAQSAEDLQSVAQGIYNTMRSITYVPLELDTIDTGALDAGQIVQVTDALGNTVTTYIMHAVHSGSKVTLSSSGNATRDGTSATNQQSYTNLTGKVLEISASVDGLKIVNRDLQGNLASLELTVEGIETNVQKQLDDMTDYVDEKTGEIKDQAVSEAVSSAMQQVNESLNFYPTKVEMQSAIEQSASEINLTVSQKLTGYSTTSQMQQYVNGQTSGILDDAKDYTDGQLKLYPTTIEMNSAIEQSAASIKLSVNETLTMYPSNTEMEDYVDGQLRDYVTQVQMESAIEQSADNINLSVTQRLTSYSTTSQMQSYVQGQTSDTLDDAKDYTDGQVATRPTTTTVQNMIDIGLEGITLSASTNGTTSTITLKSGSTTITSAQIKFTGLVTFTDLYTSGKTQINADNITTGTVGARILSSSQGASVNDICATEIDAGVIYTKVGSLAGAERTIFSLSPLYDSSNGNYYAQMQFKGDLSTWQEMNLYMGEGNFNIVSPPNGPGGIRVGLVITVDDLTMWNDMILHGDLNVASILSRVPEWRYSNELSTYVLCGPRTA